MSDWARWFEISGYGMDALGILMGAWYVASKFGERVQRDADEHLAESMREEPGMPARYSAMRILGTPRHSEQEMEADAEELLTKRMSPFVDPFLDRMWEWGKRVARGLESLGWFRWIALAPLGLVFLLLFVLFMILLVPLGVVGYFFDLDNDVRLRVIVLAFLIGTILEVAKPLLH